MIVTINTDASYSHAKNRGTFAFWIVSNSGKIKMSGVLKESVISPTMAEMQCIINALYVTLNNSGWVNIGKIIINTDSLNSIHVLTKNESAIKKYNLKKYRQCKAYSEFYKLIKDYKGQIELRHVRSHNGTDTANKWVNEWCDQEAKKEMNKLLKTL